MNKAKLIQEIILQLKDALRVTMSAAAAAHEAATHEESVPEDPHDTRGLEASYLASAQADRAQDLHAQIAMFEQMATLMPKKMTEISAGAVVELQEFSTKKKSYYFIVTGGGGATVQFEGQRINVVSTASPLGEAVLGKKSGDAVEVESKTATREYQVLNIL